MEFYNKILCVTFEELTGGDKPVIKGDTLIKMSIVATSNAPDKQEEKEIMPCMCMPPFPRSTE